MFFKREQPNEVMPRVGQLVDVAAVTEHGYHYMLAYVQLERIHEMREHDQKNLGGNVSLGVPTYCAVSDDEHGGSILDVWPSPDRDMEIKARYFPPMQEC